MTFLKYERDKETINNLKINIFSVTSIAQYLNRLLYYNALKSLKIF